MKKLKTTSNSTEIIIYKAAVREEKAWRREKHAQDIAVIDQLLEQVRALGYPYRYFADITNRENTEKSLLELLSRYIGRFQDAYFSAALTQVVGIKGNVSATEIILKDYTKLSNYDKRRYAGFYDNALSQIKDKRYLSAYIALLKEPEDAIKLPLTMIMLGKWQLEEAKPYFLKYLDTYTRYPNNGISDLVYISMEALSHYLDLDGTITKTLESKLNTNNKDFLRAVQKAINQLKKRQNKTGDGSVVS